MGPGESQAAAGSLLDSSGGNLRKLGEWPYRQSDSDLKNTGEITPTKTEDIVKLY